MCVYIYLYNHAFKCTNVAACLKLDNAGVDARNQETKLDTIIPVTQVWRRYWGVPKCANIFMYKELCLYMCLNFAHACIDARKLEEIYDKRVPNTHLRRQYWGVYTCVCLQWCIQLCLYICLNFAHAWIDARGFEERFDKRSQSFTCNKRNRSHAHNNWRRYLGVYIDIYMMHIHLNTDAYICVLISPTLVTSKRDLISAFQSFTCEEDRQGQN